MKQLTGGIMFILLGIYTVLIAPRINIYQIDPASIMMSLIFIGIGFIVIITQGFDSK
jgi:hypothetical protein